ncbi:MAG: hypothetical protein K0R71_720 [Bacillales bacterium]|jgi:hypothetical protein|nr:hypothetical protein [Bacillales bacterium]
MPKTIYQNSDNSIEDFCFEDLDISLSQTTKDFLKERDIKKLKSELRQGYKRMGTINLSIAEEFELFGPIEISRGAIEDE